MSDKKEVIVITSSEEGRQELIETLKAESFDVKLCNEEKFPLHDTVFQDVASVVVDLDDNSNLALPFCAKIKKMNIPVIVLIPKHSISWAVRAAKIGIRYIYEKPINHKTIQAILNIIQSAGKVPHKPLQELLSAKEKKVLRYILKGLTNKQISSLINKSIRTIEEHRASIMSKMAVDNVADLVGRAMQADLLESEKMIEQENCEN